MKFFTIYDSAGKIGRVGVCTDKDFAKQAQAGEFIIEAFADQRTQKVIGSGQFRWIVDKTPEEIGALNPPEISESKRPARINNEQWQDVLNRLSKLEDRA